MNRRRKIEIYLDGGNGIIGVYTIHRVLEIFINSTPTGILRNKLCDANIEAMTIIIANIKKEKDESDTRDNT